MKERDYASYIEDIIEHMNYTHEFIRCMTPRKPFSSCLFGTPISGFSMISEIFSNT